MEFSLLIVLTSAAVIIGGNKVAAGLSYYFQNSHLVDDPDDVNHPKSLPENIERNGIESRISFSKQTIKLLVFTNAKGLIYIPICQITLLILHYNTYPSTDSLDEFPDISEENFQRLSRSRSPYREESLSSAYSSRFRSSRCKINSAGIRKCKKRSYI